MPQAETSPSRHGVVAVILRGSRFLVIRRSQYVRAPGMHCFPGGAIEPGESPADALRREMLEELNLVAEPTRLLWHSVTPWNVHLTWFFTDIDPAAEPIANPLEVETVSWLTADEFRALPEVLSSNLEFLDAWQSGRFQMESPHPDP